MIAKYVTCTYEIKDTYTKALLKAKNAKVKIEPSNDETTKLVIFEKKRRPYEFSVQGDTLTVKPTKAKWYNFFRVGIDRSEIKLLVPSSILSEITVNSNVGHVDISSINCNGTIDIQVNTAKTNLENVSCHAFNSKGNSGSVTLNNFAASKSIAIKRNSGKVLLNDCSAPEIRVKTNTGKVCGRLPSNMTFITRTNTGRIELPKAPIGEAILGSCEIKTNTGSIKFE